jgi:hypothetical protein
MPIGWGMALKAGMDMIGGAIKGIFGYKEKKVDLEIHKETKDAKLQMAWWEFLKSQDSPLNKIIRPLTASFFIGDFIYQQVFKGGYKIITIVPQIDIGGWNIGPITNGVILTFILLVMFPLRGVEKILLRKVGNSK